MAKLINLAGTADDILDVSQPVGRIIGSGGKEGPNEREDVLLVQYMLKKFFTIEKEKPRGQLVIDGVFGHTTHYWMLYCAQYMRDVKNVELTPKSKRGFVEPINNISGALETTLMKVLSKAVLAATPGGVATLVKSDALMPPALGATLKRALASNLQNMPQPKNPNLALRG